MTSFTFYLFFIPLLAVILLAINFIFATYNPNAEKRTAFECGFHSFLGQNRSQFSISFFIFALLFLLFDLEILLIYPYALSSNFNDIFGLLIMLIFFILLTIGFIFELGKKALIIYSRQNRVNIVKSSMDYSIALYSPLFFINEINISIDLNEVFYIIFNMYSLLILTGIITTWLISIYYNIILGYIITYRNRLFIIYSFIVSLYLTFYLQQSIYPLEIMDVLFASPSSDSSSEDSVSSDGSSSMGQPEDPEDPDDDDENHHHHHDDEEYDSGREERHCPCNHEVGEECSCDHHTSAPYPSWPELSENRCCYCDGERVESFCTSCSCIYHNSCHYGTDIDPDSDEILRGIPGYGDRTGQSSEAGPSEAGPSRSGPSRSSEAEPSQAGPSEPEDSQMDTSQDDTSQDVNLKRRFHDSDDEGADNNYSGNGKKPRGW